MVTAYLLILPLTAILYAAAKEQLDVTSRQLNSLAYYVRYTVAMRPCFSQLRQFTAALCSY